MKSKSVVFCLGCSLLMGGASFADGLKKVIANSESTVYGIAYENGIATRALIAANNLQPPYALREGQELIIPSANEHIVARGETLYDVAEEYGVKLEILAQENNLQPPYFVNQGDHLSIPARDTESLTEALKPASQDIFASSLAPLPLVKSAPAPQPRASAGDSSSLAPLPQVSAGKSSAPVAVALPDDLAAELAQEKGAKKDGKIASDDSSSKPNLMGDMTKKNNAIIPVAVSDSPPSVEKKRKIVKLDKEKVTPVKEEKVALVKEEKAVPVKEVKKEEKKESIKDESSAGLTFAWPVSGKIISKFTSGKNDGINIKTPENTPVKASASGEVMYAGSELKAFGNLVLIKHAEGWITAYAHNSSLQVKKGDKVNQGQVIAKSGKTGDAKESQVHFEIRKGKQPIDPLSKLES